MTTDADEALIAAALRGEEEAFVALYERHKGPLFGYARRLLGDAELAADAVQEAFEYFFRNLARFRFESGPRALLFRAVRNRCLNLLDWRRRRAASPLDETGPLADGRADDPAGRAEQADLAAAAHRALDRLPDAAREVVVLRILQGRSTEETARILDVPEGTVKSRLHDALGRLRKILGKGRTGSPGAG